MTKERSVSSPKLTQRLNEEVVILQNEESFSTGAQAVAPEHSPRSAARKPDLPLHSPPAVETGDGASLQHRVEQFLYQQAELLDGKHWGAYVDLFTSDGVYWMPASPEQTEWLDSPSIFAEDVAMMQIRVGRVTHPNAWSQAPAWGTSHLVGNAVIESDSGIDVIVRSRFHMMELRRDSVRHFAGTYRHTLRRQGEDFRITLQRVDLLNGQAPFDYVLQVWV
jgi:3-phenylpropionate/cinnamic acid dioxygenase small subunit